MITYIQLQVLPEVAANPELLLKVVSEKTNTKKNEELEKARELYEQLMEKYQMEKK